MTRYHQSSLRNRLSFVLVLVLLVIVSLGVFFATSIQIKFNPGKTVKLEDLWKAHSYSLINAEALKILEDNPLDKKGLFFFAVSNYHLALRESGLHEQILYLNQAIMSFRKLKIVDPGTSSTGIIDYYMGKAYLLKGPFFADLGVANLSSALAKGVEKDDIYEFLGEGFFLIADYPESLKNYKLATELFQSDRLFAKIARVYQLSGDLAAAEEYYEKAVEISKNQSLKEYYLNELGLLFMDNGDYNKAIEIYNEYLNLYSSNINVLFQMGEAYHFLGNKKMARKYWHKAVNIDSKFRPALLRLYN